MAWLVWLVHRFINTRVEIIEGYVTRANLSCSTSNLDESVISALQCLYFFCKCPPFLTLCISRRVSEIHTRSTYSQIPLFVIDHVNQEAKLIKYTEFYNESLNGFIDFMDDFKRFRERTFSLCNFPFVLTVATKANILKLESSVLMREKLQVNILAHRCRCFFFFFVFVGFDVCCLRHSFIF